MKWINISLSYCWWRYNKLTFRLSILWNSEGNILFSFISTNSDKKLEKLERLSLHCPLWSLRWRHTARTLFIAMRVPLSKTVLQTLLWISDLSAYNPPLTLRLSWKKYEEVNLWQDPIQLTVMKLPASEVLRLVLKKGPEFLAMSQQQVGPGIVCFKTN